ncbi:MAG TPA: hypothetical protein VJ840_11715 [Gemmatimonadaceae bacterium]|nr:hypothetical protein [Gemmatimonadaceae bacterium]
MTHRFIVLGLAAAAAACSLNTRPTIDPTTMKQLWEYPADLEQRDLFLGPGGAKKAPDPNDVYTFVEAKGVGTQPGYDVKDSQGREWSVKLGPESRTEVTVSRLVWAIGYRQPTVYYLPHWTLLRDGKRIAQTGARFRLDDTKNLGEWSWRNNPFHSTRELTGLWVFMVMVNNADLKSQQNAIYQFKGDAPGPRVQYVVKDLGATFGATAWPVGGSKDNPDDFDEEAFVERVEENRVHFAYRGSFLDPQIQRTATPADVRWTCQLLSRLTPDQWRDAFRAGGFSAQESARYITRLKQKIAEGLALDGY